jgi:hypothetical protein
MVQQRNQHASSLSRRGTRSKRSLPPARTHQGLPMLWAAFRPKAIWECGHRSCTLSAFHGLDTQPVWQSQRDCGPKPGVGAPRLPWEGGWGASSTPTGLWPGRHPLRDRFCVPASDHPGHPSHHLPGFRQPGALPDSRASRKNNLSNYGAGILTVGKALARRISAGSVTSEQRRQRPIEPARMLELFFRDA